MGKELPLVSVIMGIYNCAPTLNIAIDSILSQTYTNWELIMCDDGSKDNTYQIALEYQEHFPDKIKVLKHKKNLGLNQTLNDCIAVAKGEYIARMDGDDISLPERFKVEMQTFEEEPDLSVVSCKMIFFDENGEWGREKRGRPEYPTKNILARCVAHNHAPSVFRANALKTVGGYTVDRKLLRVEDWHLWIKLYKAGYYGKNIDKCLYMVRDDKNALKRKKMSTAVREFNVSSLAIKELHLAKWRYIFSIRSIVLSLLPKGVYSVLHKWKNK